MSDKDHSTTLATLGPTSAPLRPPGAVRDDEFMAECLRCGDCIAVCPRHAIHADKSGYPSLLSQAGCTQCGLCADVCMHGAIEFTNATSDGLRRVLAANREQA